MGINLGKLGRWADPSRAVGKLGRFLDPSNINRFRAQPATLDEYGYKAPMDQAQQRFGQTFDQQSALAALLNQQGMGEGPNPAKEMLAQQTGTNIMEAQGLAAGQRGVNPAMRARTAIDAASSMNQQAAGQGAILTAQQQLAARQQLAGLLATMGQQQGGMFTGAGQLQNAQNQARIANQLGAAQINAATSAQNAGFLSGMVGQGVNAAGSALAMFGMAEGGGVPGYAEGGSLFEDLDSMMPSAQSFQPTLEAATTSMPAASAPPPVAPGAPGAAGAAKPGIASQAMGLAGQLAGGLGQAADKGQAAFDRMMSLRMPTVFADGGMTGLPDYRTGGPIPGVSPYPGNDERNDTVHIVASPGEIVIPRTEAQGPDAPEKAKNFVEHLMRSQGIGYDRVLKSRGKNFGDGGAVETTGSEPSIWEAVKNWWATKTPAEAQPKGKEVAEAINAALPEGVSARGAVKKKREQLRQLDEQTKVE